MELWEQIRQEAIKCRFRGEWLEPTEPDSARKLTTATPVLPPPIPPQEVTEARRSAAHTRETLLMPFDPAQIPGGYWRPLAEAFIQGHHIKPFLGRPYLKLGQCLALWGSLFELGAILGAKHAANIDAFVSAFLGMSGKAGTAQQALSETATKIIGRYSFDELDSMTCWDYVERHLADHTGYKGEWSSLLWEHGTQKIPLDAAARNAWGYASDGAGLGTMTVDVVRAMFERTHAPVSKERWQKKYASGLDIGPEPPARRTYEEAEEEENKIFMEYCQQFRPDLYSVLKD